MKQILNKVIKNQQRIVQQLVNIKSNEYSAFEVMPNKIEIAAGTVDSQTGLVYTNTVSACTIHKMTLRSEQEPEDCDVVIDWGDGTVEAIKNGHYVGHTVGKAYELEHDYAPTMTADTQRFIVRIYGKDYYTFRFSNAIRLYNLISRIFDYDLPIARHVGNFASICYGAMRLLKVEFPHSTEPYSYVWNWVSCFCRCRNLISVTGFEDQHIRNDADITAMFRETISLETTDFVFPAGTSSLEYVFASSNVQRDISEFFPKNGMTSTVISIKALFRSAQRITGIVPADILWKSKTTKWILDSETHDGDGYVLPFINCSTDIINQVPVSWGGNAAEPIENSNLDLSDYTAFEVFAHDYDIPSGICAELNNSEIIVPLSAEMRHKFVLRSDSLPDMQDVIVDWGDGNYVSLQDIDIADVGGANGNWKYTLEHTYNTTGKYIIKIYGKKYYAIISSNVYKGTNPDPNIICRVFDRDLPIASHLRNLSSFARYSQHLTTIYAYNCPSLHNIPISNFSNSIAYCKNLKWVDMPSPNYYSAINQYFQGNKNLKYITSFYPTTHSSLYSIFNACENLEFDIQEIFYKFSPIKGSSVNVGNAFKNCKKIYGTVPADKLWNNKDVVWTNTTTCFTGCSDEILAQVPISWGGLASDDIIQKNQYITNVELSEVEAKINELSAKFS